MASFRQRLCQSSVSQASRGILRSQMAARETSRRTKAQKFSQVVGFHLSLPSATLNHSMRILRLPSRDPMSGILFGASTSISNHVLPILQAVPAGRVGLKRFRISRSKSLGETEWTISLSAKIVKDSLPPYSSSAVSLRRPPRARTGTPGDFRMVLYASVIALNFSSAPGLLFLSGWYSQASTRNADLISEMSAS